MPYGSKFLAPCCSSTGGAIGEFHQHNDIGPVINPGTVTYEPSTQIYTISGSGKNIWANQDEFSFLWKKLTGDFILQASVEFEGKGVDPHRKIGWMIRRSLDADSAYVDATVHGDGLTSLQYRQTKGDVTKQVESEINGATVIQLSRKSGKYTMSVAKFGDMFTTTQFADIDLGDDVFVGLFVCSHNAEVTEKALFKNVRIVTPAQDDFRPYRDYIGSHLEVMDVSSGHRRVVHSATDSLQAPNWTRDGKALVFNRNGRLYRFEFANSAVTEINSGFATQNNNDHVISHNGDLIGISHHTGESRKSVVYTLPIDGGTPKQITTSDQHSYFHDWSPDDKFLIYTAQRNGDFDIFRIPSVGGEEINLTNTKGLDDGSEYSPDGRKIYFNSTRSGLMQVWSMNADGTNQIQVTDDEFNNWFPHFSPDGKSFVVISYDKSVPPQEHPFYKDVCLRLFPTDGGSPKVIANLYGGQGTINVSSWSPDGSQIAFVSNSQFDHAK